MGSSRVRMLVVVVVVAVVSAGCVSTQRYPRPQPKPAANRGTPAITVTRGGQVSVGGVTVTILAGGVDRDSILHVTGVPNMATPAGTSIATPVVALALENARLTKPATIDLPITAGIAPSTVIGGFFDKATGTWKPLPSGTNSSTGMLQITTRHLSRFFGIRVDPVPIVRSLTDNVTNPLRGRAGARQPDCPGDHDHGDGIKVTSNSGDRVKWCSGVIGGHRELTVTNNRAAAVTVTYPSVWSRGNVTGSGMSLEAVGRRLSMQEPAPRGSASLVVGAGGSVVFSVPDGRAEGRVTVEMNIMTWALSGFEVAASATLAVYRKFLKVPTSDDEIIDGALTDGEAAGTVDFVGCMKTALAPDIDLRRSVADAGFDQTMQARRVAITCGFSYVSAWIKQHVKGLIVSRVLAVVSTTLGVVASGLTADFGGLRSVYDTTKGATRYAINLHAG